MKRWKIIYNHGGSYTLLDAETREEAREKFKKANPFISKFKFQVREYKEPRDWRIGCSKYD